MQKSTTKRDLQKCITSPARVAPDFAPKDTHIKACLVNVSKVRKGVFRNASYQQTSETAIILCFAGECVVSNKRRIMTLLMQKKTAGTVKRLLRHEAKCKGPKKS